MDANQAWMLVFCAVVYTTFKCIESYWDIKYTQHLIEAGNKPEEPGEGEEWKHQN